MKCPAFAALPTVVGSFPHTEAPRLLTGSSAFSKRCRVAPTARPDWLESMYVQYSEGLPGAVVDGSAQTIYFRGDEALAGELEAFYQALVDEDVERFAISPRYALGLHLFLESVPRLGGQRPKWVKGQVTGPFSFAMTVTDENKRSLAYNPELYEVAVQGMAMKARWMARKLREVAENALVVLDEPYLCAFGSAFVNVPRNDVIAAIDAGWPPSIRRGPGRVALLWQHRLVAGVLDRSGRGQFRRLRIFSGLSLYPAELSSFFAEGRRAELGIVPAHANGDLDPHTLLAALDQRVEQLAAKGMDRGALYRQALLTPSCGLATESVESADRLVDTLAEVSNLVRERETGR